MSDLKVVVEHTADHRIVTSVDLLLETDDTVIAVVRTNVKHPKPLGFNGWTLTLEGCSVRFHYLPFTDSEMIFRADRNSVYICIYNRRLETNSRPCQTLYEGSVGREHE